MASDRDGGTDIAREITAASARTASLGRDPNFLLLWGGQFVSQMGDKIAAVALPWLVYQNTGSAFGTGAVLALYTLPYVLFGALAGAAVDRFNKRTLMLLTDLLRAGLVLLVPVVAQTSLGAVFALAFLVASLTVLFDPAKMAIMPEIVSREKLLRANSLLATAENVTEVVGYSLAGLLLASVSTGTVFQVDALTFLVSAAALAFMSYRPARTEVREKATSVLREIREGLSYLVRHRGLFANTVMTVTSAAGAGASYPLTFLFAVRILDGGPKAFGYLEASLGLGFLIGSLLLAGAASRVHKGTAMIVGLAFTGAGLMVVAAMSTILPTMAVLLLVGLANGVALIAIDTYVQQAVPEPLRGRVWGSRFTLTQGTYACSALIAGGLATVADIRILFVAAGALIAVPALCGSLVPEIRRA